LDKQGKDDVLKLLILGVDLVRYDRQYHVLPINGLQKYFEQMSVPVSSRPAHVETMRYEWVRVRSYSTPKINNFKTSSFPCLSKCDRE
jgi:hypothetical protein